MVTSDETRQILLNAAANEILECGYAAASLSRIASHLNLTKGALAYHFPAKTHIAFALVEVLDTALGDMEDKARGAYPDGGVNALVAFLLAAAAAVEEVPEFSAAVTLLSDKSAPRDQVADLADAWTTRIEWLLHEARELGELDSNVETDDAADYLLITLLGATIFRTYNSGPDRGKRLRLVSLALKAVGAPRAEATIEDAKKSLDKDYAPDGSVSF